MMSKLMDYANQHAGVVGAGGLGLGWITGSFNSDLQAAVFICTLIITAPKAATVLVGWYDKYWPKVKSVVTRLIS